MSVCKRHCISFALAFFSASPLFADHPSVAFGNEASGAINTISSAPIVARSWSFGLRSEIIENDAFSSSQLESFASAGIEGVHSVDKIVSTSVTVNYGLTANTSISARLPYVKRTNIREGELEGGVPETHSHGDSAGLGDLLLVGRHQLIASSKLNASMLLGIKAPTGKTDLTDKEGVRFETEFQPGSGSWDYLLGASISTNRGNLGYHASLLYNKTTEGSQSTENGDAISYGAALTYLLTHNHDGHAHHDSPASSSGKMKIDLSIELNGETRRRNKISGVSEQHSGGTTITLSPGIRISSEKISGFVSYGIPLQTNHKGKQTDIENRIVAGLSISI